MAKADRLAKVTKKEVEKVSTLTAALDLLPRLSVAIEKAKKPEEINEIRAQIATLNTYIKSQLPKVVKDRKKRFALAFNAAITYVQASIKAGELWDALTNKQPPGRPSESIGNPTINVLDAGFRDHHDAGYCLRVSSLDEQDRNTYFEECKTNLKMPSLGGLKHVYDLMNPKVIIDPTFQDLLIRAIEAVKKLYDKSYKEHEEYIEQALDYLESMKDE